MSDPIEMLPGEHAELEARNDWSRNRQRDGLNTELPPIPHTKPFYRTLLTGEHGRVWVHRHTQAIETNTPPELNPNRPPRLTWQEPGVYGVFESDGTYLGEVLVPGGVSPQVFRGDTVWGWRRGEFDEPYLVRGVIKSKS